MATNTIMILALSSSIITKDFIKPGNGCNIKCHVQNDIVTIIIIAIMVIADTIIVISLVLSFFIMINDNFLPN